MDKACVIEDFFGVYLLHSLNEKCLRKTYIGYTVNPNRRINQHNKGSQFGGARKTSNRGPWKMILIVHGFPNNISALRFEWAWQHPQRSCRLMHLPRKKKNELCLDFCIRILSEMIRVGPWNRLPLKIRWLESEYVRDFAVDKVPPLHMPICYGPVESRKITSSQTEKKNNGLSQHSNRDSITNSNSHCDICKTTRDQDVIFCINPKCDSVTHLQCLANFFLPPGEYVPIEGDCSKCGIRVLWGDLIRKMKGCKDVKFDSDAESMDVSLSDTDSESSSTAELSCYL